ncbi:uncharacterized protein MYCFIDRAFT_205444 [Pseudocercospora fijiensis CIRAD86]|uniref:Heterokaryon incompatibility domain-containing protein n=1 Tax=Pseudocercospora fijiensis (strain CIRAD86) TaxID=383855 RepID=M2YHH5_PSEFD|nr:uncharacterized protein MYCFIDRAFT_205444 [Pseudocercospora fijiensis CIRAD86]EME77245.1 hypothetical protein MYCFIDRAFT_205444 [Pseudocercospora fijiensis CIRAD86]
MKLIRAQTVEILEGARIEHCRYAIVSHRWGDEEIEFQEFGTVSCRKKAGWKKVEHACRLAREQGYEYVWIDTCCIDKKSSAELSQAINSMFEWYQRAEECFVFLTDVVSTEPDQNFKRSDWFNRGWTLQELLACKRATFYNKRYEAIGTKAKLAGHISDVTSIDAVYLQRGRDVKNIHDASLAERMSWAAKRKTERPEDIAYCLLGIFEVNMPLLYGEGGTRAFLRLQLQIIEHSDDESILAWPEESCRNEDYPNPGLLAQHPRAFEYCASIKPLHTRRHPPHTFTSRGLELHYDLSLGLRDPRAGARQACSHFTQVSCHRQRSV